ncbi:MAG: YHS domain-containing protein [Planctomycetota bacterium]|jgi:YHS domain-containing protein
MKTMKTQWPIALVLIIFFTAGVFLLAGCKKKSEPAPAETKQVVSEAIEQKTCPVLGGAINKGIYTEYKGKKVYFCCPGCKEKFEKKPEKYISKLPQFSN